MISDAGIKAWWLHASQVFIQAKAFIA